MRKLSTFVDCLLITAVAVAAPTANEDFVVAEDAKTYTNAVNAANAYTDGKIAEIPEPDFSTNNTELVETIEAKAPTPDLSPFLRNDKQDSEVQIFGGLLSGFGFHADTGHNDNGWNQYTAHNGTALAQSLPTYIQSNPWNFLKQGEAIPTTGGVFNAYIHLNQKFSVGTWTQYVKPIESSGGSGIAFAFGDNVQTRAANTMVLGVGALNTNNWSFIWNGDANRIYVPTQPNISNPYSTRYNGGFHVNPSVRTGMTNPLQNFWIGDTNLATWISTLAPVETDPTVPQWAKAPAKPTYTASEVGALSSAGGTLLGNLTVESTGEKSEIRAEHGNEYISLQVKDNKATIETSDYTYIMPNSDGTVALTKNIPNVPAWALAAQKPTYSASEVGAYSTNETMYVDWIGDIGCIYGDYMPSGVWDFGDGCLRLANWYQFNVHMTAGRQSDGIEIFDTSDPTIKTVIPINGSDVATIADIPASVSNIVTATYINDRVNVTPLAGRTYNFATNIGLYTAVRDIIQALGGSVTNFPAIPQN